MSVFKGGIVMEKALKKETSAKSILKQLTPGWIISFVFCYMLLVYEPLVMYCPNKYDFWFDFGIMLPPMLKIFLFFFIALSAILTGVFFLSFRSKRFSDNLRPYKITLLVVFLAFIVLYIQGNYLIGDLPALDGSQIDWSVYKTENLITLAIFIVLAAALIFTSIKFGLSALVKCAAGLSLAVFGMLTFSLVIVANENDLFYAKDGLISTTAKFNEVSEDKNFFIFMVDAQNAPTFSQVIADEEFEGAFDDFTYFPDTLSVYPYTRDSIPFILSGRLNKNEENFGDYSGHAFNDSELFKALDERGYSIALYSNELIWYGDKEFSMQNELGEDEAKIDIVKFMREEMRYVWFKYLPYAFKPAAEIEYLDFDSVIEQFDWRNDVLYKEFTDTELVKTPGAQFRFIHAEGAHIPLNMDENLNRIKGGTYLQKSTATAKLIRAFIERLKAAGVYDDAVIIIMADHGFQKTSENDDPNYILKRFNPILLIKGAGEKHELIYSDKPVSYLDLPDAYPELLDGKQSTELFPEAEYPRTRTAIWYEYYEENHMVEYQTDGKAEEWEKFTPTGNVYDLSK